MNALFEKFDINSCRHNELLWYYKSNDKLYFPNKYYELYLIDFFEDNNIKIFSNGDKCFCYIKDDFIIDKNNKKLFHYDKLYDEFYYSFNFDVWYPYVKNLNVLISNNYKIIELSNDDIHNIKNNDIVKLVNIKNKIDKILNKNSNIKNWFVKTSNVSPKDIYSCDGKNIKLDNSYDILNCIIKSDRAKNSLNFNYCNKIILTEWINLPTENEFRCFIYNDKLRCISQYSTLDFRNDFHLLFDKFAKKDILEYINKFYEKIKYDIPYQDCVMDIVFMNKFNLNKDYDDKINKSYDIYLIEFNPFCPVSTGTCLFNWINDYHILYSSNKPLLRTYDNEIILSSKFIDITL